MMTDEGEDASERREAMMVEESAVVTTRSKPSERMDLGGYLQQGLQILQLDARAIKDASRDEDALLPAILFFALAGVANGAGQFSFRGMLFGAIVATLVSFVLAGLIHVLSRVAGGSASVLGLYQPLGLAASLHWVHAVPLLGPFLGVFALLYFAVVCGLTIETVAGISRARAAAVVAVLVGLCLFLFLVFFAMLGSLLIFRALFS